MGYYSDVRMTIEGPEDKLLAAFAAFALSGVKKEWLDEYVLTSEGNGRAVAILGHGGVSWKWYSDYEDVKEHERIWSYFSERENEFSGAFIRVGEDAGDIEHRYFGDHATGLAWTSTQIVTEYDGCELTDIRNSAA